METENQLIAGIKTAINNVKLVDDITGATYMFSFSETMNKVAITPEGSDEVLYPANIVYRNEVQVVIAGTDFALSSFIQDGKIMISLNDGVHVLRGLTRI